MTLFTLKERPRKRLGGDDDMTNDIKNIAEPSNANRVKVSVEKETKKALLVSADGKKGWIQKRWADADMTVSSKTFEKAACEFEQSQKDREADRAWRQAYHALPAEIERETEKAIALKATLHCVHTDQVVSRLAWFPKSQIKNNAVPGWLIDCKVDELRDREKASYSGWLSVQIDGLALSV